MSTSSAEFFPGADVLEPDELELVDALRGLITELRPPAVSPASTHVRAETTGADLLLGHSLLPGLALAVEVGGGPGAGVYWLGWTRLDRSDWFDIARGNADLVAGKHSGERWVEDTLATVRRELERDLRVAVSSRRRGAPVVEVQLPRGFESGEPFRVWRSGRPRRRGPEREWITTSFMADPAPLAAALE